MSVLLVTGGAGYVGSHTVRELVRRGERVVVLDDLSQGHEEAVRDVTLVRGEVGSGALLDEILTRERVDVVLHFAGSALVGESVRRPEIYYRQNVGAGVELLAAMSRHDVKNVIFSSTCATYGLPDTVPIAETHPQRPVSAYGRTKLAFERALLDFEAAYEIRHVNLRYFNAAGAHPDGDLGEDHDPETHLIPLALDAAFRGGPPLSIFGTDYPTPDGTCVRDYVHVCDLADAHVRAVDRLRSGGSSASYNLGIGNGCSVLEVVDAVRSVTGKEVPTIAAARRAGDPEALVADGEKARTELKWRPRFLAIEEIVETAWRFKLRFPEGFGAS